MITNKFLISELKSVGIPITKTFSRNKTKFGVFGLQIDNKYNIYVLDRSPNIIFQDPEWHVRFSVTSVDKLIQLLMEYPECVYGSTM